MALEPREIKPGPIPEGQLLRLHLGLNPAEGLSPSGESPKGGQGDGISAVQSPGLDKTGHVILRFADGSPPCHIVGRHTHLPIAAVHSRGLGPQSEVSGLSGSSTSTGKEIPVVKKDGKLFPWPRIGTAGVQDNHDGCKRHRLGSTPSPIAGAGFLESEGRKELLALEGVESDSTSCQSLPVGVSGPTRTGLLRQLLRGCLCHRFFSLNRWDGAIGVDALRAGVLPSVMPFPLLHCYLQC